MMHVCQYCGHNETGHWHPDHANRLVAQKVCQECDQWIQTAKNGVIKKGHIYYYSRRDGELSYYGEIPNVLRERIKDTERSPSTTG